MAKKKPQKKRGSGRMLEQGYRAVTLWLDKNEYDLIQRAARLDERPVATWCRRTCFDGACEVLTNQAALGPDEPEED